MTKGKTQKSAHGIYRVKGQRRVWKEKEDVSWNVVNEFESVHAR